MAKNYDFSGWATVNNLKCSDGRTIMKDAFKGCDGITVPLVWNHQHNDPNNVLGHALLTNKDEGVYTYGTFNDTEAGRNAKLLVEHGDVVALSIYANQLKQNGGNVLHGAIREVSLVLAGANPGALIDSIIAHGEESDEEAIIYTGEDIALFHAEEAKKEEKAKEEPAEEKKEDKPVAENKEKTVQDVIDSMNEDQKNVLYALVGEALGEKEDNDDESEGGEEMKQNAFDYEDDVLQHDAMDAEAMKAIIADGKKYGTLKESFLAHAEEYGITDIDWLFPEAKQLTNTPGFITRQPDDWVSVVMNGVHKTPFSRIKTVFADLREDDARAKGYAKKAQLKKEEVFGLLKRETTPTTIYKKQKLDRDDVIDITDFDVVSWLKGEMRMMLDEEIARAILFGDGRTNLDPDKISQTNIRPVAFEDPLFLISKDVKPEAGQLFADAFIDAAVEAQDGYEGSGNITLFVANTTVTKMLLLKDKNGRRIYKDVSELALACSVSRIVKVPEAILPEKIYGVALNLNDYNVGADKGGAVSMFDDFDIDYNQMKYLIETRCSGALIKPFSAIVFKEAEDSLVG